MPCTIVVGGQFGSEGKGKVTALLSKASPYSWVVRCGGPNSGHTVTIGGRDIVFSQIPSGAICRNTMLLLSAGSAISEDILLQELNALNVDKDRIIVDPRAVIIQQKDRDNEAEILATIASTCSGTGAALATRLMRTKQAVLAKDSPRLRERTRIELVAPLIHDSLERGINVIVEGTQGFGLSLLHGPGYPYLTSRDTSASGFASEVGLSPHHINDIIIVIRTFPIRVGGTSGKLPMEITWEEVARISDAPKAIPEYTSVTKRLRRVGKFDASVVKIACQYNKPTALAVMGLDRLDYGNYKQLALDGLTEKGMAFLDFIKRRLRVQVKMIGTGFKTNEMIWVTNIPNNIAAVNHGQNRYKSA